MGISSVNLHVDSSDEVRFIPPGDGTPFGCLQITTREGSLVTVYPPTDVTAALDFVTKIWGAMTDMRAWAMLSYRESREPKP